MTRKEYIRRTLAALCGTAPARPDEYHRVARMADEVEHVIPFDTEDGNGADKDFINLQADRCLQKTMED